MLTSEIEHTRNRCDVVTPILSRTPSQQGNVHAKHPITPDPNPTIRRRRRFAVEQKQALLDEASLPGNSISILAREHDIAIKSRVMRAANLVLPKFTGRVHRPHTGTIMTLKSNVRWCSDGFEIRCWNGEKLHIAFAMDSCDRDISGWVAKYTVKRE